VPRLIDTDSNLPYFYVIVAMLVVTYLILGGITRSRMGLAFTAIGQNMEAARTSGINPTYYRIVNWTVSCGMAGWLGGFYAHYYGILTPDLMATAKTIEVLAIAYIGGRGSLWGGAVVAFPFMCIMETIRSGLSNLPGLHLILYGLLLIAIMIYYPGGIAQFYRNHIAASRNRFLRSLAG
jgi:branched-chain amino acid transport system permease protein